MTLLHSARVIVRPRYRLNWIRGRSTADGFDWYVRGTNFPTTHEAWLRSLLTPFQGDLFVDIGAHIGTWAIRATRTFQQVVAFEPSPVTNRILRTTIQMNRLRNITVFLAALSNTNSSLVKRRSEFSIPVRTLDSYRLKPSLIKIDTEGNEYPVLLGAVETIRQKPRVVVETHSPESLRETRNYLTARGYFVREIRRMNRFNQLQSWLICN